MKNPKMSLSQTVLALLTNFAILVLALSRPLGSRVS
jgi:hypothetical protein